MVTTLTLTNVTRCLTTRLSLGFQSFGLCSAFGFGNHTHYTHIFSLGIFRMCERLPGLYLYLAWCLHVTYTFLSRRNCLSLSANFVVSLFFTRKFYSLFAFHFFFLLQNTSPHYATFQVPLCPSDTISFKLFTYTITAFCSIHVYSQFCGFMYIKYKEKRRLMETTIFAPHSLIFFYTHLYKKKYGRTLSFVFFFFLIFDDIKFK